MPCFNYLPITHVSSVGYCTDCRTRLITPPSSGDGLKLFVAFDDGDVYGPLQDLLEAQMLFEYGAFVSSQPMTRYGTP